MKIRAGFVSNSSSSSFVVKRHYLSPYQVEQIKDHINVSKTFPVNEEFEEEYDCPTWFNRPEDAWEITVGNDEVSGFTIIDNFNMRRFLREIGVPMERVTWSD